MTTTTKTITLVNGQKVFFFSDPHYGHKNICRGTSTWELKEHGGENSVMDFDTVEQMNDTIVNDINNIVRQDDYLVCLGDWSFGGVDNIWNFRKRIVCKNIILVLGNHDEKIDADVVLPNCFYNSARGVIDKLESTSDWDGIVNAQELFIGVYGRLSLTVKEPGRKTRYECNHFPWVVWDQAHHDVIHLYGHCHGSYTHSGRALDVGIDNIKKLKGNFQPLSELEIENYMDGRVFNQVSHHNKNTD